MPRPLVTAQLLMLSLGSLGHAAELRAIADVPDIQTYRVVARYQMGDDPPLQLTEVDGAYGKNPDRHDLRITVTEGGRDPMTIMARQVDGRLFASYGAQWAEVEKMRTDELNMLAPEQLIGIAGSLEHIGNEVLDGRAVSHLRGDREDLLALGGGGDGLDFKRTDSATVDCWVDDEHGFILALRVTAEVKMGDGVMPVDIIYGYEDFNEPVAVEAPEIAEQADTPPSLSQADVTEKLGFAFPVPEGAGVSIYGATVNLLTAMPLADARRYAEQAMDDAGFVAGETVERAADEFYTDYAKGERGLGVLVFQVTDAGATIQVGAVK